MRFKHVAIGAGVVGAATMCAVALAPTHRVGPADIYPPSDVPGAINTSITQANINQTLCNPNWSTKSIRPDTKYTNPIKLADMQKYHLSGSPSDYELDHLISLELGGNPTAPSNLWMEAHVIPDAPDGGASIKDKTENALHTAVCQGTLTLAQAQKIISTDWYAYYQQHLPHSFGALPSQVTDPDDETSSN